VGVNTLSNTALRDKISEYRSVLGNLGPSNIRIFVRFVTLGLTNTLSAEFTQELEAIRTTYDNDTFESFSVEPIGADELIELAKIQERQTRRVDADIKIRYDTNNPSLIKYYAQDLKGLVCSVPALEIARIVNDNPDGAVFDLNVRKFLGTRGSVNRDILKTCTDKDLSFEFWFLNNGITIVCDHFDPVTDPDNPHVKLKNLQIVNGCQTATTLAIAQKSGTLAPDSRVIIRIYETDDSNLVSRIVLTTNNQNQINSRDLRANDPVQLDMENGFSIFGYFYERKPRQYDDESIPADRIFANEAVAQSYLAIVLKTPSDARARKYKVWGELHARIFSGGPIEPYVIAALLSRYAADWLRKSDYASGESDIERLIAKRGSFHVARIAAFLWRGDDKWENDATKMKPQVAQLEDQPDKFAKYFDLAFRILSKIITGSEAFVSDVDRALKSGALDREIDKRLYDRKKKQLQKRNKSKSQP
jgi:hypothetical protein